MVVVCIVNILLSFAGVDPSDRGMTRFQMNSEYAVGWYRLKVNDQWNNGWDILHLQFDSTGEIETIDTLVGVRSAIEPVLCDTHSVAIFPDNDTGYHLIVVNLSPDITLDTIAWFSNDSIAKWINTLEFQDRLLCEHYYSHRYGVAAFRFDEYVVFVDSIREGRPRKCGECWGVSPGDIAVSGDFTQILALSHPWESAWSRSESHREGSMIYIYDCMTSEPANRDVSLGRYCQFPRRANRDAPIYLLLNIYDAESHSSDVSLWELSDRALVRLQRHELTPEIERIYGPNIRRIFGEKK